jgi:DHA2 family multidrug resistance protein
MTATAHPLAAVAPASPATPAPAKLPWLGIATVLLGAVISTLYGRVTTFGLVDIRGAVGAGVDEGAWITTAATTGQMLMAVLAVWLGAAFGARRVLLAGTAVFSLCCLLIPLAPDLRTLIALQFVAGLGSGTFVPVAVSFVMRNLPPAIQVFGISAYAMSLELSQNVPASLEGFYVEQWGWQWIFWQHAVLGPLMLAMILVAIPREPVNFGLARGFDIPGILCLGAGASLAYAALDQGDRLDWLHSGLVVGLLAAAAVLLAAFVHRELTTEKPFFDLRFAASGNLPKLIGLLIVYRFLVLATAYVVPQFLVVVQGYRALEVGDALLWIAAPQLLFAPLVALALQRVDARYVISAGFALIALACLLVGQGLTRDWASGDFVPSQLIQALGQSCALTGFVWFATRHLVPAQALTFGAVIQTFRLLGGEIGIGFMTWFVRASEGTHSNLLGSHVSSGGYLTQQRLASTAAGLQARALGPADAQAKAASLLGRAVQQQAYVLAFIDAMMLVALAAVAGLLLVAVLKPAPTPAAPRNVSA